jgi:site-specific recombinase XerD
MDKINHIKPNKIQFDNFTKDNVLKFLSWLETTKNNCASTRNQRLCAIKSFCNFVMQNCPEYINLCSEIIGITFKKTVKDTIKYIPIEDTKLILSQIDTKTKQGRRDLTLLSLLYNTGARVQELIDLTPDSLRLDNPAIITLYGKGRKKRIVPLEEPIVKLLKGYIRENGLDSTSHIDRPLFFNSWGGKLTTPGITYIIRKYVKLAKLTEPDALEINITPHTFRHSRAMHLLQVGVPLLYIRDILGHVSITTTEIYARADMKFKRDALSKAYEDIGIKEPVLKTWEKDPEIKAFLKNLEINEK